MDIKQIKRSAMKKDREGNTCIDIAKSCKDPNIRALLEDAVTGVETLRESESDGGDDDIFQSINGDVLINDEDLQQSPPTGMPRDVEKEYLLKIKEDFDHQYKAEMVQKEKAIKQLQEMVVKQNEVIQDMKKKLTTPEVPKKKTRESDKEIRNKPPKTEKERPKEPKISNKMTLESRPSQKAVDVVKKIIKRTTEVEESEYEELIEEDAEEEDMNSEEEKNEIIKGKLSTIRNYRKINGQRKAP
jgi:hypothetical protein